MVIMWLKRVPNGRYTKILRGESGRMAIDLPQKSGTVVKGQVHDKKQVD